jgi:acylphosphatase
VARLHIRVSGRVQGVGFRWYVRETAERWHLAGWVRNCLDGSVELEVDCAPETRDDFLAAIRRGPPGAMVREIVHLSVSERTQDSEPLLPGLFRIIR